MPQVKESLKTQTLGMSGGIVKYFLYKDTRKRDKYLAIDTDPKKVHSLCIKNGNNACFARMNSELTPSMNRLWYDLSFIDAKRTQESKFIPLSITLYKKWLRLNIQNNFLPSYVSINRVMTQHAIVFDLHAHSKNELYVYLSVARLMLSDPDLVKNILILTEKGKISYHAAMIIATKFGMHNMNHHFLPNSAAAYGGSKNIEKFLFSLHLMIGLYRFIKNEGKTKSPTKNMHGFNCNHTIATLSTVKHDLSIDQALDPRLSKIIKTSTEQEARSELNKIKAIWQKEQT